MPPISAVRSPSFQSQGILLHPCTSTIQDNQNQIKCLSEMFLEQEGYSGGNHSKTTKHAVHCPLSHFNTISCQQPCIVLSMYVIVYSSCCVTISLYTIYTIHIYRSVDVPILCETRSLVKTFKAIWSVKLKRLTEFSAIFCTAVSRFARGNSVHSGLRIFWIRKLYRRPPTPPLGLCKIHIQKK